MKKTMFGILSVLAIAGCATITRGTTQTVAVNTPGVSGARCVLTSSLIGSMSVITPAVITIPKGSDNVTVRCTKECYQEASGILSSNLEGMTAGNVILGGVVGLGIDAASGAMNKWPDPIG